MNKEEKEKLIGELVEELNQNPNFYLTDISTLNVEKTSQLRRMCHSRGVRMRVVKNTMLRKAMERTGRDYSELFEALHGNTSVMFAEAGNVPAKLIQEFRRKSEKPVLKGAFVEQSVYLGDEQLLALVNLKSKNELIGDIIALLQSPAKNVIGALQSSGGKLAGIVKTLQERPE